MDIDIHISKIPVNLLLCVKVVSGHWHVHLSFTIYVYIIKNKNHISYLLTYWQDWGQSVKRNCLFLSNYVFQYNHDNMLL